MVVFKIFYKKTVVLIDLMNICQKQLLEGVPRNQFKSGNIETLYILKALKEPVQINYNSGCSVME